MNCHDGILQPPLRLSEHIMEVRVKILEIYLKFEEILSFNPQFSMHLQTLYSTLAIMLSRTAMFWLQQFTTSISLVSSFN